MPSALRTLIGDPVREDFMNQKNERPCQGRPGGGLLAIAALIGALTAPWAAANAQSKPMPTQGRDPTNLTASVPPVHHRSDLRRVQGAGDAPLASWAAANRTVNQIGGWRVYAREKLPGDQANETSCAPPTQAASSPSGKRGHEGHATNKELRSTHEK